MSDRLSGSPIPVPRQRRPGTSTPTTNQTPPSETITQAQLLMSCAVHAGVAKSSISEPRKLPSNRSAPPQRITQTQNIVLAACSEIQSKIDMPHIQKKPVCQFIETSDSGRDAHLRSSRLPSSLFTYQRYFRLRHPHVVARFQFDNKQGFRRQR
jgi:hypothetical protein